MSKKSSIIAVVLVVTMFWGVILGLVLSENLFKTTVIFTGKNSILQEATEGEIHKININTATSEDLSLLPGIGQELAERIITHRQTHGPFLSLDDLLSVDGVGKKKLEAITEYITVGG